jgi:ribosomal protein S4
MSYIRKRKGPLFKKFLNLRENVQNRKKVLKFKKNKWENFIKFYQKKLQNYQKFKPVDHSRSYLTRYGSKGTSYQKRFRNKLHASKSFRLFYGNVGKSFLKKKLKHAITKQVTGFDSKIKFLEIFETKLTTVLYRAKFCKTIEEAGQLILHGKVFVNHNQIKSKSYLLKYGDLISLDKTHLTLTQVSQLVESCLTWPLPPKYLLINYKTMQILFFKTVKSTNLSVLYLTNLRLQTIINNYLKQH